MSPPESLEAAASIAVNGLLVGALGRAVVTDIRARRIGNRVTYPAMLAGLIANAVGSGGPGALHSALGWLLGLGIMLIPFVLGAMGAGDVKLMAAIGALKGPEFVLAAALYASIAGGLIAICYVVKQRRVGSTFHYLLYGWAGALFGRAPKGGAIPYAPAIAAGALVALLASSWNSI
jgi:prepilin peptidase CpaA